MKFFLDNTLPPLLAKALQALVEDESHTVIHLREKFLPDIEDGVWINALAQEGGWIIISGDPRITRNPHERAAWLESQLTAFFLKPGWTNLEFWVQASKLVALWPRIMGEASRARPGSGFLVPVRGQEFERIRLNNPRPWGSRPLT